MRGSTINGTVTTTVTLGSSAYPSPLTITSTGAVMPASYGATGVYSDTSGSQLTNFGWIQGAAGAYGASVSPGAGGIGADMLAAGTLRNSGTLAGGAGGASQTQGGGAGGIGVDLAAGGQIVNKGLILGGAAGAGLAGQGGAGGVGVAATHAATMTNSGTIAGGAGNSSGVGGAGVDLAQGALTNAGLITGGMAGVNGGTGVNLGGGATLTNHGTIAGGRSLYDNGGNGVVVGAGASLVNIGTITGGDTLSNPGGSGGAAVRVNGGTFLNSGQVEGGGGIYFGGPGVYINGGTLINAGQIEAGPAGNLAAAVMFGENAATLVIEPGATFVGSIYANGVNDTLALAAGKAGVLNGIGTTILGFQTVEAAAESHFTIAGSFTMPRVEVDSRADLTVAGGTSTTTVMQFLSPADATLTLEYPREMIGSFSGFSGTDRLILDGIATFSIQLLSEAMPGTTVLGLYSESHQLLDTLTFQGIYKASDFNVTSAGGNTTVSLHAQGAEPFAGVAHGIHVVLF